ncbi:2-hydroxyacid dehydrogenase [Sphingomonas sp. MG17]|uniref:2-hydroxyacid dehydrogenase n=1 Tax=Sphingomonas tagetis TaxID=2949092 RepID=A0A9X2HM35_9SPHN|nr:NAD(P)-dependent oxidoreductase [Sphingomonas tagetis]MCP3732127.1 2-hydroxyacid dehydrogenase [Sphingomonas tagetis]
MSRPLVLLTTPQLDFAAPALLERYDVVRWWEAPPNELLQRVKALVCMGHHPLHMLDRLTDLAMVACFTAGYDAIDLAALRERNIVVCNAGEAAAEPVAEFALALILASTRNVAWGNALVHAGHWGDGPIRLGRGLPELKLGIVGMGAIGRALAAKADVLGMSVHWWGPRAKPEISTPRMATLLELAAQCDVLALCARSDETNRHMVSRAALDALGPTGLLVNVARGQLVDEDALRNALCEGRLGAAALDVFEVEPTPADRWAGIPNLLATPHIAGATKGNAVGMTAVMRDNLDRFFDGLAPSNRIV